MTAMLMSNKETEASRNSFHIVGWSDVGKAKAKATEEARLSKRAVVIIHSHDDYA